MARELGPKGIKIHASSSGPLKTRAASGVTGFDLLLQNAPAKTPSRNSMWVEDIVLAVGFPATDADKLFIGETLYIDGGYYIID